MRSGPELVRASNPYASEDRARTWRLLAIAILVFGSALAAVVATPFTLAHVGSVSLTPALGLALGITLKTLFATLAGLTLVRLFIFYHDYLHGAVLTGSKVGKVVMHVIGYWVLAGPSVWKQTHDYHHKHTAKMVGASIGSYPIVTVDMWGLMTEAQRRDYKLVRHPLTMAAGYFTVFVLGMCISPYRRNPQQHKDGIYALLGHVALVTVTGLAFGWGNAFFAAMLPVMVATGLGSYLFYAQHNFPDMQIRGRHEWEYTFAALHSSSMMDMSPLMHWFSGNIGYHHVHHLNHRIPFYRLPEAMAALPELQSPHRTRLTPASMRACLALKVWDPASGRMISYEEANSLATAAK